MTTTSTFKREELQEQLPDENAMLERRGFQTRGFRRELGPDILPVNPLDQGVREIEAGNKAFMDEDSDFSLAPTGLGEAGGAVGITEERGDKFQMYRKASHIRVSEEDEEVDADNLSEKQRAVLELFDLTFDSWVFRGIQDENGNTIRNDIFSQLKSGIPTARTLDLSTYGVDADLNGVRANIFREEAYSLMEGHYFDDSWAVLIAKHPVHAKLNQLDTNDGAGIFTEWDISSGERVASNPGLIDRKVRVPSYLGLPSTAGNAGSLSFPIDSLGSDEALLLPSHNGDWMQLWEQPSPDVRDPIPVRGWGREIEYKIWGGHAFDTEMSAGGDRPVDDAGNPYPDAIHITNVSSLF